MKLHIGGQALAVTKNAALGCRRAACLAGFIEENAEELLKYCLLPWVLVSFVDNADAYRKNARNIYQRTWMPTGVVNSRGTSLFAASRMAVQEYTSRCPTGQGLIP